MFHGEPALRLFSDLIGSLNPSLPPSVNLLHVYQEALESFMGRTHFTLGTELGISVGPLGRTAGSDLRAGKGGVSAAFAYAHSRGLFVGVSIETGVVVGRPDVNAAFYGTSDQTVRDLLTGFVPPPKGAHALYKALKEVTEECRVGIEYK